MERISKHDVNKLTTSEIKKRLPFLIVSDGEIIAKVVEALDVNRSATSGHDVNNKKDKLTELPLSKKRQGEGRLSESR